MTVRSWAVQGAGDRTVPRGWRVRGRGPGRDAPLPPHHPRDTCSLHPSPLSHRADGSRNEARDSEASLSSCLSWVFPLRDFPWGLCGSALARRHVFTAAQAAEPPGVPAWKLTNGGRMLPPSGSVENCLARASRKLFGVTVDGNSQCGETTKGQGRVRGSMKPGFQDRGACFCPLVAVRSPLQSVSLSGSPALGAPPLLISPAPQLRDMLGWGRSGRGPGMLVSRWT